jgi:hypothetical protein
MASCEETWNEAHFNSCCKGGFYLVIWFTDYWQEGSASAAVPPASTTYIVGQHNKIGDPTFGAPVINIVN